MRRAVPFRPQGLTAAVAALIGLGWGGGVTRGQVIVNQSGVTYSVMPTARGARITVISSDLIERVAPGKKTLIAGTESSKGRGYQFTDTFPWAHLGRTPTGMRYDYDHWGRARAGYPYGFPRWGAYPGTYQDGVVIGATQRLDEFATDERLPDESQTPVEQPVTTAELVERLLHEGDYPAAIKEFDSYGTRRGDRGAAPPDDRLKAWALAGEGEFVRASEEMLRAYLIDPELAGRPLDGPELVPAKGDLRGIINDCVRRGHKDSSDALWLLVGVLMQSEGRDEASAKMIARARDHGLDREIVEAFESVYGTLPAPAGK